MNIKINISIYQLLQSLYENSSATDFNEFVKIISRIIFKTYFINSFINDDSLNNLIKEVIIENKYFNDILENEIY